MDVIVIIINTIFNTIINTICPPVTAFHMSWYRSQLRVDLPMAENPPVPFPALNGFHQLDHFFQAIIIVSKDSFMTMLP